MTVRLDFPYRCDAIEYWWIDRQIEPLTDYQVQQCDNLISKMTTAIITSPESDRDALYQRLGDFEARLNLLR